MALIADFIVIAALVSATFSFVARPIFVSRNPDFEDLFESFRALEDEKNEKLRPLVDEEYYVNQALDLSEDDEARSRFFRCSPLPKSRKEWLDDIEQQRGEWLAKRDALDDEDLSEDRREAEEARIEAALEDLDLQSDILDEDEAQLRERRDAIAEERARINEHYSHLNYPDEYDVGDAYILFSVYLYPVIAFSAFHIIYMLSFKGHSLGRRLMRLRLSGNINPLSLLLREFFWKYVYWVLTLGFGVFIDIYMCILTQDRKTPRDHFSKTRVILDEVVYPF